MRGWHLKHSVAALSRAEYDVAWALDFSVATSGAVAFLQEHSGCRKGHPCPRPTLVEVTSFLADRCDQGLVFSWPGVVRAEFWVVISGAILRVQGRCLWRTCALVWCSRRVSLRSIPCGTGMACGCRALVCWTLASYHEKVDSLSRVSQAIGYHRSCQQ